MTIENILKQFIENAKKTCEQSTSTDLHNNLNHHFNETLSALDTWKKIPTTTVYWQTLAHNFQSGFEEILARHQDNQQFCEQLVRFYRDALFHLMTYLNILYQKNQSHYEIKPTVKRVYTYLDDKEIEYTKKKAELTWDMLSDYFITVKKAPSTEKQTSLNKNTPTFSEMTAELKEPTDREKFLNYRQQLRNFSEDNTKAITVRNNKDTKEIGILSIFSHKNAPTDNVKNPWLTVHAYAKKELQNYLDAPSKSRAIDRYFTAKYLLRQLDNINPQATDAQKLANFLDVLNQTNAFIMTTDLALDKTFGALFNNRNQQGSRLQTVIQKLTTYTLNTVHALSDRTQFKTGQPTLENMNNLLTTFKGRVEYILARTKNETNRHIMTDIKDAINHTISTYEALNTLAVNLQNHLDCFSAESHQEIAFKQSLTTVIDRIRITLGAQELKINDAPILGI